MLKVAYGNIEKERTKMGLNKTERGPRVGCGNEK